MAVSFRHIPKGSLIGDGTVKFRHYGAEAPVDKYTWEAVFASEAAGTYATDYTIGDEVPLDLGSEGLIHMQIAGFDMDDKADGSGKACITWIGKEYLATSLKMNATSTNSGGWEATEIRSYLKNTIKPLISSNVRNAIVNVTKKSDIYPSGSQTTTEDVWIPSYKEVFNSGVGNYYYSTLFPNAVSRRKRKVNSDSYGSWWLRSAYASNSSYFRRVNNTGTSPSSGVNSKYGVVLSFCT